LNPSARNGLGRDRQIPINLSVFLTKTRDYGGRKRSEPMSIESITSGARSSALVTSALKSAGQSTGVSFDFLLKMAQRESSLNPAAKAKTSSAAGLFQFIEQTWLGALKSHGAKHGLGDFAADITRAAGGKYSVADAGRREEILNLRFEPKAAAALAGELANDNKRALETKLGRGVSNAELYTAHFLGAGGAARLLTAGDDAKAAALLPRAAAANRHVFYDGARARSVGEVMASIAKSMGEKTIALESKSGAPEIKSQMPGGLETTAAPAFAMPARLRGGVSLASFNPGVQAPPAPRGLPTGALGAPERLSVPISASALAAEPSALPGARLSALALAMLQALDPAQLMSGRDDRRDG